MGDIERRSYAIADEARLLVLQQFQVAISETEQGVETIGRRVVAHTHRLLQASGVAFELIRDGETVCCDAAGLLAGSYGFSVPMALSLSGDCLGNMQPQQCRVTREDPRSDVRESARNGAQALVAIPVLDRTRPIGVLKLAYANPDAFSNDDMLLAQSVAGMAGLAIGQLAASRTAIVFESRYRSLFESAKDGIMILDPDDGRIMDANPFLLELLSYSREELLQRCLWDIGLMRHVEASRAAFRELVDKGYVRFEDLPLETRTGRQIEVELIGSTYQVGDSRFVQCILRDITDRKRVEAEVARLNEELERRVEQRTAELKASNKELEAFTYSVSHDLRAPLRALVGFSRILVTDLAAEVGPSAQRYLDMIRANASRMGELIDDLLAFSRLNRQPLASQQVDMTMLVQRTIEELWPEREGRRVELDIAQLPECKGDPSMLKQVWVNLISNALKYTRRRDVAEITVGCRDDLERMPGRKVYFIADNGVGFNPRGRHKLFGVFQRLHRAEDYEGTGVGLAIAHRIIRRHGGQIWAESELNRGATFYFTLEGGDGGG